MTRFPVLAGVLLLAGGGAAVTAAEPVSAKDAAAVSYYRDVRPLFVQHCQGCHQPARPQGGYVMTGHADLLREAVDGLVGEDPPPDWRP